MTEVLTRIDKMLGRCDCTECTDLHDEIRTIIADQNRRNELSIADFVTRAVKDKH